MTFKFNLKDPVVVGDTGGEIIGQAEYATAPNQVLVRLTNKQTGIPEDRWFEEDQLTAFG